MCNQIAIAGALSGACEAIAYAKAVGLDADLMLDSISTGAAGSTQLSNVASRVLKDDYNPGFFIKHFIKDMKLASEEAEAAGAKLGSPGLCAGYVQGFGDGGSGRSGNPGADQILREIVRSKDAAHPAAGMKSPTPGWAAFLLNAMGWPVHQKKPGRQCGPARSILYFSSSQPYAQSKPSDVRSRGKPRELPVPHARNRSFCTSIPEERRP